MLVIGNKTHSELLKGAVSQKAHAALGFPSSYSGLGGESRTKVTSSPSWRFLGCGEWFGCSEVRNQAAIKS